MSLAEERIRKLFELAEQRIQEDRVELADRYIEIAQNISMSTQEAIPEKLKKKFCSNCGRFLKPGKTCKVRKKNGENMLIYTCLNCGEVERYGMEET